MKKSSTAVWSKNLNEITHIKQLLVDSIDAINDIRDSLTDMLIPGTDAMSSIDAAMVVADHLMTTVPQSVQDILTTRMMSLLTSRALLLDNIASIQRDIDQYNELISTVNHAVLVQLPSVMTQMAAIPLNPTDTQRFLAVDALTSLQHILNTRT